MVYNFRSKRKKSTQNVENNESAPPEVPGITDGKKALYHCNYCNKDISGKIRIKCVICSDFDLCVECFSVGTELRPHKSNHPYRVMDNLAFPLICPDWNADEEMLLLEGLEMYGLGNWNEVAEHVGTKNKSQCIDHYDKIYMNSRCFPLPDMSHVMGKNREELLAMAKEHSETKKEVDTVGGSSSSKISSGAVKRTSSKAPSTDGPDVVKVEDRSIGEKKPRTSGDEGVSVKELSGYNSKRQEFEVEYDNDAEQLLADMEFKDSDTDAERELKIQVLHIYSKRLDERKRRKDFILERNLLYPDPFDKELTLEEKELCRRYRVFMRFHSKEEHSELLRSIVEEQRLLKRIQYLQEARAAGCRTSSEAERFIDQKMKMGIEENSRRAKEHSSLDSKGLTSFGVLDNWDVTGFLGADLLSEDEKELCGEMKILPTHYLNMLQTMSVGILNGNVTKKSDAQGLFNVDPNKVDKVYDMLMRKGIAQM
ncbi:Transcriptional adapter ADA2b [Striga hermonthica]|uniref:Transcriptional adapter n=1 Tax=Striga hermonthica TaxID=68872 RepID=A0A9N7NK66_STRHE|nr:Transcriptional adapter ADA2b [Striga hermonthica]